MPKSTVTKCLRPEASKSPPTRNPVNAGLHMLSEHAKPVVVAKANATDVNRVAIAQAVTRIAATTPV